MAVPRLVADRASASRPGDLASWIARAQGMPVTPPGLYTALVHQERGHVRPARRDRGRAPVPGLHRRADRPAAGIGRRAGPGHRPRVAARPCQHRQDRHHRDRRRRDRADHPRLPGARGAEPVAGGPEAAHPPRRRSHLLARASSSPRLRRARRLRPAGRLHLARGVLRHLGWHLARSTCRRCTGSPSGSPGASARCARGSAPNAGRCAPAARLSRCRSVSSPRTGTRPSRAEKAEGDVRCAPICRLRPGAGESGNVPAVCPQWSPRDRGGWPRSGPAAPQAIQLRPDAMLRGEAPRPDGAVKSSTSHALLVHFSSTSGGPAGSAAGDRAGYHWRLRSTIELPLSPACRWPAAAAAIARLPRRKTVWSTAAPARRRR